MEKHNVYDLKQMQSLSLESKVAMSIRRIIDWYEFYEGNVFVSISGGKDSTVLAHLVKSIYPDVPLVFINTGLEYNSIRQKAEKEADITLFPKKSFAQVVTDYGYPVISKEISLKVTRIQHKPDSAYLKYFDGSEKGKSNFDHSNYAWLLNAPFRISHECCDKIKKNPAYDYAKKSNKKPFIGTLAEESFLRKKEWNKHGCNAFDKAHPSSQPLSFWTEQDILKYIKINNLPLAEVYGEIEEENEIFSTTGESRTGCVFCLFGIGADPQRFVRLKNNEPKKYDYIMRGGKFDETGMWIPDNGLGFKFVIDWLNENGNMHIQY